MPRASTRRPPVAAAAHTDVCASSISTKSIELVREFDNAHEAVTFTLTRLLAAARLGGTAASAAVPPPSRRRGGGGAAAAAAAPPPLVAVFDIDDTVIMSTPGTPSNQPVIALLLRLRELGAAIHIVTARLDCEDMRRETVHELRQHGLGNAYDTLHIAPHEARADMATVSLWKAQRRHAIAREAALSCVTLSVGDQWGDMVRLGCERHIDHLDAVAGSRAAPFKFVRVHMTIAEPCAPPTRRSNAEGRAPVARDITYWGLKLPDMHDVVVDDEGGSAAAAYTRLAPSLEAVLERSGGSVAAASLL